MVNLFHLRAGPRGAVVLAVGIVALAAFPGAARAQGEECLAADPPPVSAGPGKLTFGVTPLLAGSVGTSQVQPKPESTEAAIAALRRLRPPRRQLVMRLNRMFMADGEAGIRRYAAIVDRYGAAGFDSELQVRYHPGPGQEGDMAAWAGYVRLAASILGKRPSVKALSITNEANFAVSPNTSDGSYAGVRQAVVTGLLAARDQLDRMGRPDVELGFSFAWRWIPSSDAAFWRELGSLGNPRFRSAVDYVGLQVYPHLVFPPTPRPGHSAGDEVVEALTLLRGCYLPMAGLGPRTDLWVTENGYATNLGRTEAGQDASLAATLDSVHRYSGTLGVTDYRWFNLRDNNSAGTDLFSAVGLLRDDYSEKPAFHTLRAAIGRIGANRPRTRRCGGRTAFVVGSRGRDKLRGSIGPDVIVGRGGTDGISGGRGDDLVCGRRGPDRLRGGAGADLLIGGRGADVLIGGPGRDRCAGGSGRDVLRGC